MTNKERLEEIEERFKGHKLNRKLEDQLWLIEQEWLIQRVKKLTEALEAIGICTCDARFSGADENEYKARGYPSCSCEPDWMIAKKALEEE